MGGRGRRARSRGRRRGRSRTDPNRSFAFARGSDTSHSVQYYKRRPRASERLARATIDFITTSYERRDEPRVGARLGDE